MEKLNIILDRLSKNNPELPFERTDLIQYLDRTLMKGNSETYTFNFIGHGSPESITITREEYLLWK